MKRSRAEVPSTTTTKPQKRSKENSLPKKCQIQTPPRLANSKRSETIHEDDNQVQQKKVAEIVLSQAKEDLEILWDEISLEWGWWPNNGVDEELLLGWFPFEETDFSFTEDYNVNRHGGGICDEYHDIWHLQHIHELPSSSNTLGRSQRNQTRDLS